jgi:hypothetical protein
VIYTARERPGAATYGWAHDPRITDSMLKLMMGHSQSSRMGKTYYNVRAGSIGSVVGGQGLGPGTTGHVFLLCSGEK